MSKPVWIPGRSCTGYRAGNNWIGFVSWAEANTGVPGNRPAVRWSFNPDETQGSAATIDEAKRILERKWQELNA